MRRIAAVIGFAGLTIACLIAALIYTGVSIVRNVRVSDSAAGVTRVETPFGTLSVRQRDRLNLNNFGIPIYPGAHRLDDHHKLASFEFDFGDTHKDVTVAGAEFETPDSLEQVERYYRDRLPGASVKLDHRHRAVFHFMDGGLKKMVALRPAGEGTRIALASIGEAASN